jgi:4-amino-4-deoxy-L-arabinose transferase-like glycosyltransferase
VTCALLGTLALWELYLLGARLFGRRVGLLAAAIESVAFLPVFYSRLALNDVPTLVPLTLSLIGSAGVLLRGRRRDYLIAGAGLGLACATKYTAGIVLVPLIAAVAIRAVSAARGHEQTPAGRPGTPPPIPRRSILAASAAAAAAALLAFLLANPYSVLDYHSFHQELVHQSSLTSEAQGKLGAPKSGGFIYYLWSLVWGLGWVPALAALAGAAMLCLRDRRRAWLLVPAPILFLAFMGSEGRYFGRWLLPIFPILCLLAAYFAVRLTERLAAGAPRMRPVAIALVLAALCAQGVLYSVHSGLVLSRADTRNLTRSWMVAHVPAGSAIVLEPVVPNEWLTDIGHGVRISAAAPRWLKYPALRVRLDPSTGAPESDGPVMRPEDYERTLGPALVDYYRQHGYCFVVSGFSQSGRAFADPKAVPDAIAYYRALAQNSRVVYHVSPYGRGKGPVPFGFDWTFDYYPLAYYRPGPEMTVYRLIGGRCGAG